MLLSAKHFKCISMFVRQVLNLRVDEGSFRLLHVHAPHDILRGVECNHILLFAKHFFIITDHCKLRFTEKQVNKKLGRYLLVISQYPAEATLCTPGSVNVPPNTMTRSWPNPEALERIKVMNILPPPPPTPGVLQTPVARPTT